MIPVPPFWFHRGNSFAICSRIWQNTDRVRFVIDRNRFLHMQSYIARQPIFTSDLDVYAYELLFRAGVENIFPEVEGDTASSSVISDTFTTMGIESLSGGKRVFINFTRNALLRGYGELVPSDLVVIEILENVEPDQEVLRECGRLKDLGYTLALDDFQYSPKYDPLIEMADIIKVDFMLSGAYEREFMVRKFGARGIKLLAEKVETQEEVDQAKRAGYSYFQGYFFAKPQVVSSARIPEAQISRLALMQEVGQHELDYVKIEDVLKRDVAMSYRLLKYINSSFFGVRNEVSSIKQALTLLGERNVRKWVRLVCLSALAEGKSEELIRTSVFRARFCELMAPAMKMTAREDDLFLLGMFSLINAIMNQPMENILVEMPLVEDVKAALFGEDNRLRRVLDIVVAYEQGQWAKMDAYCRKLGLELDAPGLYRQAVEWANELVGGKDG